MDELESALSEGEWDLLQALWEGGPAAASQVAAALEERRGWARTTVKTLLDRMAAKGLVTTRRVGHVVEYAAAVEPAAARRTAWKRFVDVAFDGALSPALEFLARDAKLTARQRARLRELLEEVGRGD